MPRRVNVDVTARLNELYDNKDYKGIVKLIADVFRDYYSLRGKVGEVEESNYEKVTAFLTEKLGPTAGEINSKNAAEGKQTTKEDLKIHNGEFFTLLFDELHKYYIEIGYEIGDMMNDVAKDIKNGKVKHTSLIKDEPETVKKVAHDIVLGQEIDAVAIPQMLIALTSHVTGRYFNDKYAEEQVVAGYNRQFINYYSKTKCGSKQLGDYMEGFRDCNYNDSIGYTVKEKNIEITPEAELFDKLPDYVERLEKCVTIEQLDKYETELYATIYKQERFEQEVKDSVKLVKQMIVKLKDAYKDDPNNALLVSTLAGLEKYTHLGVDYVYENNEPDKGINPVNVDDAVDSVAKLIYLETEAYNTWEANSKIEGYDKESLKAQRQKAYLTKGLSQLMDSMKTRATSMNFAGFSGSTKSQMLKKLEYVQKKKRALNNIRYTTTREDEFTREITEKINQLSESLISDCVSDSVYDNLIAALLEYKRFYSKPVYAIDKEDYEDIVDNNKKVLKRQADKIKELVDKCIAYESAHADENKGLINQKVNRRELLNSFKKLPSYKADKYPVDYDVYIEKHTYERAGTTGPIRVDNLSRVIAAMLLRKLRHKFDIDEIRETAEKIRITHNLDENSDIMLESFIQGEEGAVKAVLFNHISLEGMTLSVYDVVDSPANNKLYKDGFGEDRVREYKNSVGTSVGSINCKDIINAYGPKGKMFDRFELKQEYDNVEIDIPEGLDEDIVTAVVLGSMCDPNDIDTLYTTSSGMTRDRSEINYTALFTNFVGNGDARQGNFPRHMVKGRTNAKAALLKCKNGDYSAIIPYLKNLMSGLSYSCVATSITDTSASPFYTSRQELFSIASKIVNDPRFGLKDIPSPIEYAKIKASIKAIECTKKSFEIKQELLNNSPAPNTKEREDKVKELLFESFVANLGKYEAMGENTEIATNVVGKMLDDFGIKLEWEANNIVSKNVIMNDMRESLGRYTINDLTALLAEDDGYDRIKELYINEMVKHPLYKDMVSCEAQDFAAGMRRMDELTQLESYKMFPNVKAPSLAAKYNTKETKDKLKEERDNHERFLRNIAVDLINDHNVTLDGYTYVNNFEKDTKTLVLNRTCVFMDELEHVDRSLVKSSLEFKAFKEALKKLDGYIRTINDHTTGFSYEEYERFIALSDDVCDKAKDYLDMKLSPKSDYARSRVKKVFEIRSKLSYITKNMKDTYASKTLAVSNELHNSTNEKYYIQDTILSGDLTMTDNFIASKVDLDLDPYKQGKFKGVAKMPQYGAYTSTRSAVHSISVLAFAAEKNQDGNSKYSLADIVTATSCVKEKSRVFDEVAAHMEVDTDEDKKWVANKIREGRNALAQMMDEVAAKLDFSDPKTYRKVEFRRLQAVAFALYDAGQEMDKIKPQMVEEGKKDYPEITAYHEYGAKVTGIKGTASHYLISSINMQTALENIQKGNVDNYYIKTLTGAVIHLELCKKILSIRQKEGIPYSKMLNDKLDYGMAYLGAVLADQYKGLIKPEEFDVLGPMLINGELIRNMKVEYDPNEVDPSKVFRISGIMTRREFEMIYKYTTMPADMLGANVTGLKNEYTKKATKVKGDVLAFVNEAKNSMGLLKNTLKKKELSDQDNESLKDIVKKVLKERCVSTLIKEGIKGDQLKTEVENLVTNSAVYRKFISRVNKGSVGAIIFDDKDTAIKDIFYERDINKSIKNLETKDYTKSADVIKDVAKAFTGRIKEVYGELPKKPGSKKSYTVKEYEEILLQSDKFIETIKNSKNLKQIAQHYAGMVKNDAEIRKLVVEAAKKKPVNNNAVAPKKQNANKTTTVVKEPKGMKKGK